jgi:arylsulfatase
MSQNRFIAPAKNFYYTYAIADTAVNYLRQQSKNKPFFMYVAFTAAHWPLQVPKNEIEKYKGKYNIGWDSVRNLRFEKQKKLGIIPKNTVMSTRSEEIPAWNDETMKPFQERRMETYAAMVDAMDQGIGKILKTLEENGELENTVIIYMHDNGGCAELEGSDIPEIPLTDEQKTLNPIPVDFIQMNKKPEYTREGKFVRSGRGVMAGAADTWMAYGPEWANVSNTPFRLYKSYVHQGGIASPLIINWPDGIKSNGIITRQVSHLIDIVPTVLEITGAKYPGKLNEKNLVPLEGISLVPTFKNKIVDRNLIFWEHSANRAIRIGNWKLVAKAKTTKVFTPEDENGWELYDLENDPSEMINLASKYPEKVKEMAGVWQKEAFRTKALPWPWNKK